MIQVYQLKMQLKLRQNQDKIMFVVDQSPLDLYDGLVVVISILIV
jgi:hypothetical protein